MDEHGPNEEGKLNDSGVADNPLETNASQRMQMPNADPGGSGMPAVYGDGQEPDWSLFPSFKCHKVVRAAMITGMSIRINIGASVSFKEIENPLSSNAQHEFRMYGDGADVCLRFETQPDVFVTRDFASEKKPLVGSYFVIYEDGYCSVSPAKAFDEGYTRIE